MPKLLPSPDDASQCRRPLQREHPQHYGRAQRTRAWGGTCSASCVARPSLTCAVSCARSSRHRRCSCASAMRSLAASPSGAAWEMTYMITWPDLNEWVSGSTDVSAAVVAADASTAEVSSAARVMAAAKV